MILLQEGQTLAGSNGDFSLGGFQLAERIFRKVDLPAPLAPISP